MNESSTQVGTRHMVTRSCELGGIQDRGGIDFCYLDRLCAAVGVQRLRIHLTTRFVQNACGLVQHDNHLCHEDVGATCAAGNCNMRDITEATQKRHVHARLEPSCFVQSTQH